uniref:Uncharacterized protein n=1 Tax=Anguilla anguilla TaxID=7936 RepID=A0A0E9VJF1_ANGAN
MDLLIKERDISKSGRGHWAK